MLRVLMTMFNRSRGGGVKEPSLFWLALGLSMALGGVAFLLFLSFIGM
jgi:predicted phage tail protein